MSTEDLFDRLWADYIGHTPEAKAIHDLFVAQGEHVVNDHIAYRTVSIPEVRLDVLAQAFVRVGYVERESYRFPEKHLVAKHYEHAHLDKAPRVFISELQLDAFSGFLQGVFRDSIECIPSELLQPDALVLAGNAWGVPSFEVYNRLRNESEYAAWLYVFGYRANHFTVSVNELTTLNTLEKVNAFVKDNGYALNTVGGEIKGSAEELLKQSSTLAAIQPIRFQEGTYQLPTCFYEFAERFTDASGQLYGGFIAQSANKIFESTHYRNHGM